MTPTGKVLTKLTDVFGYDKTKGMWNWASKNAANSAVGDVPVIINDSLVRSGSIYNTEELPILWDRMMNGQVNSINHIHIGGK